MARRKNKQLPEQAEPSPPAARPVFDVYLLEDKDGSKPFLVWRNGLRDLMARARVTVRITRIIRDGNFGDHRERISGAVSELRIDYGPGYRVYYVRHGMTIIILLGGGTKDSQQSDIEAATALWEANKNNAELSQYSEP